MTDTSPEVERRYRELLLRRSGEERLRMGCSMHATAQALVRASVLAGDPAASPAALRQALFLRFYGGDFDTATRQLVLAHLGRDVMTRAFFAPAFEAMTGFQPLGWQRRLFERLRESDIPSECDIPTGLGKTSVMAIWLLALASQANMGRVTLPRRLVYVVNRRTVVDQATDDAVALRSALRVPGKLSIVVEVWHGLRSLCVDPDDEASPLAISTLRGELADNREWQADPARPAIIVGTVDMIGSRLLFSGYRAGWKMRAFDAGLIGQDSLLVHDEAHLSPAFSRLVRDVAQAQADAREPRPMRVLELSATRRLPDSAAAFELTEDEKAEPLARQRLQAPKALRIERVENPEDLPQRLAKAALVHRETKTRVLVYARLPEDAKRTEELLRKELRDEDRVRLLTGTLRGHERDGLVTTPVFRALRAAADRSAIEASVFLVSTSAGEVGVNLDADHLVCDLTTLDSMVQRLGRVNRLGRPSDRFVAHVDVFEVTGSGARGRASQDDDQPGPLERARRATREALGHLRRRVGGRLDASPAALTEILEDRDLVQKAFAPSPRVVPSTDILLDAWALTTVRDTLPGRPLVDPWLHGVEAEPPETMFVWRAETSDLAELLVGGRASEDDVAEWLDTHRTEARERLQESVRRVRDEISHVAKRLMRERRVLRAVVLGATGRLTACDIAELAGRDLAGATVLLPPEAGGLGSGMLSGRDAPHVDDVADMSDDARRTRLRLRVIRSEDHGGWEVTVLGVRRDTLAERVLGADVEGAASIDEVLRRVLGAVNEGEKAGNPVVERLRVVLAYNEDGPCRVLVSLGRARRAETALDVSAAAAREQTLRDHLAWAGEAAARLAQRLQLDATVVTAVEIAARWHDRGKARVPWQRAISHPPPADPEGRRQWEPLAKTGNGCFDHAACSGYRHEFGSLVEALRDAGLSTHPERDLILHLIASHHGWARPHFRRGAWDPDASEEENNAAAWEAVRRYARLQRRFGRWGLAWLEALLKSADVIATLHGGRATERPA